MKTQQARPDICHLHQRGLHESGLVAELMARESTRITTSL
jgi:hypothetical protein